MPRAVASEWWNVGNPTSANAITRTLRSAGQPVGADTIERFLSLITLAYLAYRCDRFDARGREHLRTNGKYYAVDQALRRRVTGEVDRDRGRVLENLVYLELRRRVTTSRPAGSANWRSTSSPNGRARPHTCR